ncbi:MAG: ubiquinol oxidase subunit II [Chlamydiae bacterium]|nr:ubiquinol oxidase subunit II [Chlamydiota bacterium]
MKKAFKIAVIVLLLIGIAAATVIYIRTYTIAVLEPKGWVGLREKDLIVTACFLMLIIVIPVLLLTGIFAWRYRESNTKAKHTPDWEHNSIAEYCWWGVPSVIIFVLAVITYKSSHELNPFNPLAFNKKPITIQAVALQWKWLFFYPKQGIATVNYIEFPVDTPINFQITADAPMNSFWIPQLGGQIYAMPAMESKLSLIASEVGDYRGLSANISGTGFAGMKFTAKARSESEFNQWVKEAQSSSAVLSRKEYNQLVTPSENNPAATYVLADTEMFQHILKKYQEPQEQK